MEEQKNLTAEEMLASMQQLHDEAKQYYTDARRYRDEARRCRDEARNSRVAAQLQAEFMEKEKANWVTDGIP